MMQNRNGLPDAILEEKRFFELRGSGKEDTPAGWNNPENWKHLDDIPEDKYFGFAIGNNSNYLLIDGDHVRDPVTGQLDSLAAEVCKRIDKIAPTYSEISMSGTGFHLIVDLGEYGDCFEPETNADIQKIVAMDPVKYANLPKAEREQVPKVELFYHASGRYVYLTGKHMNDAKPKQIARNEDAAAIFTELIRIREELHAKYSEGLQVSVNNSENKRQLDDATKERIMAALPFISARERETWVRIGIALNNCGFPFEVWNEWSQWDDQRKRIRCDKYDLKDAEKVWKSFRNCKSRWNEGTIFIEARKNGYFQSGIDNRNDDSDSDPDDGKHYLPEFYEVNAKTGIPARTLDPVICTWIIQHYTFFVLGDMPYFMDEYGRYVLDRNGVKLKQIIQSCIVPRLCKDGTITAIYRMLLYQGNRKEYGDLNAYPVEWVAFRNGFFDPVTMQMHPIKPEHYLINQLPHSFDPDAKPSCPTFDKLLHFQLPEEDERELWLEYGGSCFNRDTSPQKWMIIKGGGGTGKSTQLNVLICCVGEENVSNETLQGLTERFNATVLFGKLVNICADISSQDMDKIDVLKKITGEDKNGVKHELKGKDSFYFTPFCKLLFSANEIPLNRDEKSNAYYRRLLITVMDRKPDKADRRLQKKLIGEIDGIIHRYMEALHRFYEHGGVYVESKRSIAEVNHLRHSADSVIAFFDEMIEKDVFGRIERSELFRKYEQYCQTEDRKYPVTRRTLFDRFRDFGVSETKDSNGNRCFIGIRFRSDDQSEPINDGEFLNVESGSELEEDVPF